MKNFLVPILFCSTLFAQQTYTINKANYQAGMHIVERSEITLKTNSSNPEDQTLAIVINSDMRILEVDGDGIPMKFETMTSEKGSSDEVDGKKLVYELNNGKYSLTSVDGEYPSESIMSAAGNIPGVGFQLNFAPTYPIPVGYEWDLPMSSILNVVSSFAGQLPDGVAQAFRGGLKFKLAEANNEYLKITVKGKITIAGFEDFPPGKATLSMMMVHDARTGIVSNAEMVFSCSFKGGMKAEGRMRSTQDIVP